MFATLLSRLFVTAAASLVLAFAANQASANTASVELPTSHPGDTPGKIEVLEFFSYGCSHCYALEPLFHQWSQNQGDDVAVRQVPVAFNAGMRPFQQLYYTLEAMGRLDLHPAVFVAIHEQRQRLFTKAAMQDWAQKQGLDSKRFTDTFDSFGVNTKVDRANALTQIYDIQGTPTVAVGGRYITSPSHANGYRETVVEVDRLVQQLRRKQ